MSKAKQVLEYSGSSDSVTSSSESEPDLDADTIAALKKEESKANKQVQTPGVVSPLNHANGPTT